MGVSLDQLQTAVDTYVSSATVDQTGGGQGDDATGTGMDERIAELQESMVSISENWDNMSNEERKEVANDVLNQIKELEGIDPEFVAALDEGMAQWDAEDVDSDQQHDFVIMLQAMLMMMEMGISMKKAQRVGSQVENELAVGFLHQAADKIRSSAGVKFGMALAGAFVQIGGAAFGVGMMNRGMHQQGHTVAQGVHAGGSMFNSTGEYFGQLGQADSEDAKADSQEHQYLSDEAKDIGQGTGQFFQALLQGFLSAVQAERGAESKGWFAV